MRTTTGELSGVSGVKLFYQGWLPDGDPVARLFVSHGLNEHGGRYAPIAEALAARGFAVWALDQVGHGRSEGVRSYVERFDIFIDDTVTFMDCVPPANTTFVYGNSMGSTVALRLAQRFPERVDGLVLTGTALLAGASIPRWLIAVGSLLSTVAPRLRVMALPEGTLSHDPAVSAAIDSDPLVYTGKVTARLGAELLRTMADLLDNLQTIHTPMLIMHGSEDRLTDPRGSALLYERAGAVDKTLKLWEGMYHEIHNEPAVKDAVIAMMGDWMAARLSLPRARREEDGLQLGV